MYRHFAVVTVCLTAAIAIFADGESRKAVAEEIEARERHADLERAETEKFGQAKLIDRSGSDDGHAASFASDGGGGSFGEPMDDTASQDSGSGYATGRNTTTRVGAGIDYAALGLTQQEFERLSAPERQALLREFRALRAQQTRSLLEGSAARGGNALEL